MVNYFLRIIYYFRVVVFRSFFQQLSRIHEFVIIEVAKVLILWIPLTAVRVPEIGNYLQCL